MTVDDVDEAASSGESTRFDAALAVGAPEPLRSFNRAGILSPADIHVARALLVLAGLEAGSDPGGAVALGTALAVRAPRLGHVFVDLADVARHAAPIPADGPTPPLAWPEPEAWVAAVAAADTLVASGEPGAEDPAAPLRPLRRIGSQLFLDRYWRQERSLADALLRLDEQPIRPTSLPALTDLILRLFPDPSDHAQRSAATCAALRGLTVIAGGPGTGKTTTVARTVALLAELAAAAGQPPPLVALCAPTGRAAARLGQAVAEEAAALALTPAGAGAVARASASTIHRLLGAGGERRFRHHQTNPLAHDVVIVDETSMVSLSLLAHLIAAVRRDAQVVLVGDPDQLSAIEAGAVLRDIVGDAAERACFGPGMRSIVTRVTGTDPGEAAPATSFGSGVVVLRRGHRFGASISAVAEAIRSGDAASAAAALSAGGRDPDPSVRWLAGEPTEVGGDGADTELRTMVRDGFSPLLDAAADGRVHEALAQLGRLRILCAHRHGRHGVRAWTAQVHRWLADLTSTDPPDGNYAGRPLLLTENDYELRLFNGDTGVVVRTGSALGRADELTAVFARETGVLEVAPTRLASADTAYVSTIHKSQGSQFDTVVVILPDPDSRLLSRELLYTAVTRARRGLLVVGTPDALTAAVNRPVQRATGLGARLWG